MHWAGDPRLRHRRGMTVEAARRRERPQGLISQVENSRTSPSLATLNDSRRLLQTPVAYLVVEEEGAVRHPRNERKRGGSAEKRRGSRAPAQQSASELLQAECSRTVAGDKLHYHHGEEIVLCLEGRVQLTCGQHTVILEAGDSCHYDGRVPHAVENAGDVVARVLIAITPAAFEPLIRVARGDLPARVADVVEVLPEPPHGITHSGGGSREPPASFHPDAPPHAATEESDEPDPRRMRDFADAARAFSRPSRLYLLTELLAWTGSASTGCCQPLPGAGGFDEAFVGRAVSLNALGLAISALPAGWLADRWGRRPCMLLGAALAGAGLLLRSSVLVPEAIYTGSFLSGAGQALLAIVAMPFLTEQSTPRERTHLFSAFFACSLIAGVIGSMLGGWLPSGLALLPAGIRPDGLMAFRATLVLAALIGFCSALPVLAMGRVDEAAARREARPITRDQVRMLGPIA